MKEPYIYRYGITVKNDSIQKNFVYPKDQSLFNSLNELILASGTLITKARFDTTRDESTDR